MKRFKPSAKPCVNCRKIKGLHKRVLGVLLCPKLLSRRPTAIRLFALMYLPMPEPKSYAEMLDEKFMQDAEIVLGPQSKEHANAN